MSHSPTANPKNNISQQPDDLKVDKSHSSGGTGLGLSIASELLKLLDETIFVESTPGNGACFTFSIQKKNSNSIGVGKMKRIPKEKLIVRPSMSLFFGGGEIWFEQLDALSVHKDIVLTKFRKDMETVRKPSSPSMIAVNLNETVVDREVADTVVDGLHEAGHAVRKVVFVGLNFAGKRLVSRALQCKNPVVCFDYTFINDYEKAKEWLIPL